MLFDGRLDETVKHTHKGTSFTKHCNFMSLYVYQENAQRANVP